MSPILREDSLEGILNLNGFGPPTEARLAGSKKKAARKRSRAAFFDFRICNQEGVTSLRLAIAGHILGGRTTRQTLGPHTRLHIGKNTRPQRRSARAIIVTTLAIVAFSIAFLVGIRGIIGVIVTIFVTP